MATPVSSSAQQEVCKSYWLGITAQREKLQPKSKHFDSREVHPQGGQLSKPRSKLELERPVEKAMPLLRTHIKCRPNALARRDTSVRQDPGEVCFLFGCRPVSLVLVQSA